MFIVKWYSIIVLGFVLIDAIRSNIKKGKHKDNIYIGITLIPPILYILFN